MGVFQKTEDDTVSFKVSMKNKPMTTGGTLFILSSVFEPHSFGAPFLLMGKHLLQRICKRSLKWFEALP